MVLLGRQMEVAYLCFERWLVLEEIKKNAESLVLPEQRENLEEIDACLASLGYKFVSMNLERI